MKGITITLFLFFHLVTYGQEICNNAIDDDNDGLIDLNDTTDCSCAGTVYDNGTIIQSLIPNSSFEEYACCPTEYSQMSCSNNWVQVSDPTSDYYNTCGYVGLSNTCLPYPHGNGVVGMIIAKDYTAPNWNYQEYVGTCLSTPLLAGKQYTMQFFVISKIATDPAWCAGPINFGDIDLTIFGNPNCVFNLDTDNCPPLSLGWEEIGSVNYIPTEEWSVVSFSFTPTFDVYGFTFGSPCDLPTSYAQGTICVPYFVFDGMILSEYSDHVITIKTDANLCDQSGSLIASSDTIGGSWQWYYNGVALIGAISDTIDFNTFSYGAGSYTAIYTLPSGCYGTTYVISNQSLPTSSQSITTCESYLWPINNLTYTQSGIYHQTLTSSNNCDSVVILNLKIKSQPYTLLDTTICNSNPFVFFDTTINQSGTYQYIIQGAYGCDSIVELELNFIETWDAPAISVILPKCPEDQLKLNGNFPEGSNVIWSGPGNEIWNSHDLNLDAFNYGTFEVYYTLNGCPSQISVVDVDENNFTFLELTAIPNIITPNNDEINDKIDFNELFKNCEHQVRIFNRWGNTVYHQNIGGEPFVGLSQDGDELGQGVYFYSINFNNFTKTGFIELIR